MIIMEIVTFCRAVRQRMTVVLVLFWVVIGASWGGSLTRGFQPPDSAGYLVVDEQGLRLTQEDRPSTQTLSPSQTVLLTGKVPINRASASVLETIPGIGPSLASRIMVSRESYGPFLCPQDLLRVPGIGMKRALQFGEYMIFGE